MKKINKLEEHFPDKNEIVRLILLLPVMFVLMIVMYFIAERLSVKSSKVCNFLGKIWISQAQMTDAKPEGCYTYEQLAKIKFDSGE
jgi:hypothetical protein